VTAKQSALPGQDDPRWFYFLVAGLAVLLMVRIFALDGNLTDLFFDEAQYWYWSLTPDFGYYSKPPLIAWIIRASTETCGVSEFCIRLPSPLIHTATACAVAVLGARLYDLRTGAISGLVFATLPGVSVSAGLISTDVPLLFFWALALTSLWSLMQTPRGTWWPALLLGLAVGAGLNAKYAMAWFVVCLGFFLVFTPERRSLLADWRVWAAMAIGIAMIVPNIIWNAANRFATFSHTADNANWGGSLFHPNKAAEFFLAQFGVFGPILFAALLIIAWRASRQQLQEADRYLLAFALPIVAIITLQALLSRAHANWAAVSYVAACVLVTATMIRDVAWKWLAASAVVHIAVLALVVFGTSTAGRIDVPGGRDPFARTLGWEDIADATRVRLEAARKRGQPYKAVITDKRALSSELAYYMRDEATPVYAFRGTERPRDHFEMTRPFRADIGDPVLLVSLEGEESRVLTAFESVDKRGERVIPAGQNASRTVTFYALGGYKAQ